MRENIRVVRCTPNQPREVLIINDDLETLQGLVGGYIRNTSSVPVDKNTVRKSINETGFQILNIPSVAAVAISIVAYKAIVAGSAIKLAFAGGSALWVAIVNYFNGGGQK